MRMLFAIIATVLTFASASQAQAQGFLLGMMVGGALSSGGTQGAPGRLGETLYLMPDAADRVKDPLDLRMISTWCSPPPSANNGRKLPATIMEQFRYIMSETGKVNADDFEIIEAKRLPGNEYSTCITLWFTFIEKSKLLPKKVASATGQ